MGRMIRSVSVLGAAGMLLLLHCSSGSGSSGAGDTGAGDTGAGDTGAGDTGAGDTGAGAGDGTAPGVASVETLADIPTMDLSTYDYVDGSPGSLSLNRALNRAGEMGELSRAGCEASVQKQEIIQRSQEIQLDRCYMEAMETAGLVTFADGEYVYLEIQPPEMKQDHGGPECSDVPEEHRAECEQERQRGGPSLIRMRAGRFGDSFHVDMCEAREGEAPTRNSESTYTASGSVYRADVVWMRGGPGHQAVFNLEVNLGTDGRVKDTIVELGTTGTMGGTGTMVGDFGNGTIRFSADGGDQSNEVTGAFNGTHTDPRSGQTLSHQSHAFAKFGDGQGCSKYEFGGNVPAMLLGDMMDGGGDVEERLAHMSTFLGIELTPADLGTLFLCPNPEFDPQSPVPGMPGLVVAHSDGSCGEVTHAGVECFSIAGTGEGHHRFRVIADDASEYFAAVAAYDIASIQPGDPNIQFTRDWDCGGDFQVFDFDGEGDKGMPPELAEAAKPCMELDEKMHRGGHQGNMCAFEQGREKGNPDRRPQPPEGGHGPVECREAGITDMDACKEHCAQEGVHCGGHDMPPDGGHPGEHGLPEECRNAGIMDHEDCKRFLCEQHGCDGEPPNHGEPPPNGEPPPDEDDEAMPVVVPAEEEEATPEAEPVEEEEATPEAEDADATP